MNWIFNRLLKKGSKANAEEPTFNKDATLKDKFANDIMNIDEDEVQHETEELQRGEEEARGVEEKPEYDLVGAIMQYESGELDDSGILELFSHLIKTGQAWTLQGHYGRTAAALIDAGYLDDDGNVLKDIDAEAKAHLGIKKQAAYEKGDDSEDTIHKDLKLRISGLSDYNLAEFLAEKSAYDKQLSTTWFNEEKEKVLKSVKSDRSAAETKAFNLVKDHAAIDKKKAFEDFEKWEHKPATEEGLRGKDWAKKNWRTNDKDFDEVDDKEREEQMEGVGKEEEAGQVGKEASKKTAKFEYKRVKIDSPEAEKLQDAGHKVIKTDPANGYVTFEIEASEKRADTALETERCQVCKEVMSPEEYHVCKECKEKQKEKVAADEPKEEEKAEGEEEISVDEVPVPTEDTPKKSVDEKLTEKIDEKLEEKKEEISEKLEDKLEEHEEEVEEKVEEAIDEKVEEAFKEHHEEHHELPESVPDHADSEEEIPSVKEDSPEAESVETSEDEKDEKDDENEIESKASKKEVLKKVAEIESPWRVIKNENGEEIIARVAPAKNNIVSRDDDRNNKKSKDLK